MAIESIMLRCQDSSATIRDRVRLLWRNDRRRLILWCLSVLPVVGVALTTVLAAILMLGPSDRIVTWNDQHATIALSQRDFTTARLCYSGLLQRDPDNPAYQLGLAISLAGLDQTSAAMVLMNRLAPDNADGYPPAHLFLAEQLLTGSSPTPQATRAAESHLLRVTQAQPMNIKAHALLAAIYAQSGRWEQVKEHLALGGPAVDELGLIAAESFAAQGDRSESDAWAKRAARFFRSRVLSNPQDYEARLKLAQALVFQRDFALALEILEGGWDASKQIVFRRSIAQVYAMWLKDSGASLPAARKVAMLQRGLDCDPQNGLLLQLATEPSMGDAADTFRPSTQPFEGAAMRSVCLSIAACRLDQPQDARKHLKIALALGDPQLPAIIANMACVWAYGKDADASSAVVLSSALVDLRPREPVAQRAQGLVLAKQGRWNLAAAQLETAMIAMPNDPAIHSVLAACYDPMGMPAQAAQQRRLAQAATQPAPASRPAN